MATIKAILNKVSAAKELTTEEKVDFTSALVDARDEAVTKLEAQIEEIDGQVEEGRKLIESKPDPLLTEAEAVGVNLAEQAEVVGKEKVKRTRDD